MRKTLTLILSCIQLFCFSSYNAHQTSTITSIYFTHLMKCGGSTMDSILYMYSFNRNKDIKYETTESARKEFPKSEKTERNSKSKNSVFSIIIVRNAVDRVISHWV